MKRRPRPARRRLGRGSLRTRLVVSAVALIAVVAAVIGAVTTIAFRSYLYDQLDAQVLAVATRASGPPPHAVQGAGGLPPGAPAVRDPLLAVTGGGAPVGTVGAEVSADGSLGRAVRSTEHGGANRFGQVTEATLNAAQTSALATVARDGSPHTVALPGLGDYRVRHTDGANGDFLVGLPLAELHDSLDTLVLVEVCVTAAGLVAAGLTGNALIGVALRPLRRVAGTARRVSELPLHSGEVSLLERVPDAQADPGTEVGQVGAALNRMLGHVGSALAARQESETRVRRFVADAGHELRTPLASIRGYAELTRRGREETGPDTRHALRRIDSEATRMAGLVDDLLLLARLDQGRPLESTDVDLVPLVVDAVGDARAAGPGHRWALELPSPDEGAAGSTTVPGDASRLHQVLVNLFANARTHTPRGTTVVARVSPGAAPGAPVRVEIEDDGPGIPAELLPRVFERFARGDASRSRAAGSTGLGLAIVRAVVTTHGGTVGVASRPGRTVFTLTLPGAGTETTAARAPFPRS
ncbi:HAMP domain-containing sensor histidine kinase [Streptomyces montanisoli]|uniref:histidine kinase n=1 Tax=Streptomyces montanisoli TaxID=2798581 RepID=A0A940MGF8_9ACTN|nr:HAMP domain-containing sensor histidine kinase [Streptomyces montanisoli]MBP0458163.1 HAMP domain-containing histidine kinase [Streptomyces montanisoli]